MARKKRHQDIYPVENRRTETAFEAMAAFAETMEEGNIKGIFAMALMEDGRIKFVSTMQHGDAMLTLRHAEELVLSESLK